MILRHAFIPAHNTRLANLCGPADEHLRTIEAGLQVSIAHRHEQFKIDGPKKSAERALAVLQALFDAALQGFPTPPAGRRRVVIPLAEPKP